MDIFKLISKIEKPNISIEDEANKKINLKTKPIGSLGKLESMAIKMSIIQNNLNPSIKRKVIFVFAGDHGIVQEGVSAFPAEVTPQMVINFINGGAAINVLCNHNNIDLSVIDMGVNYDFPEHTKVINKKIKKGTNSFLNTPAMSLEDAKKSIENGFEVFNNQHDKEKIDIIGIGDMGIGNTTSSSAIISAITNLSAEKTTGKGTGIDDSSLAKKIEIINRSLSLHKPNRSDSIDILAKIGGFEIGGMAGSILAAAANRVPIVLDGIISCAAGLLAYNLNQNVSEYMFAAHKSIEQGQQAALKYMNLSPLLDLNMRLGEGTGAALAINLIEASCKIMSEMSSFEDAGVSNKK